MLFAALFFIGGLPIIAFYIGIQYQKTVSVINDADNLIPIVEPNTIQYKNNHKVLWELIFH